MSLQDIFSVIHAKKLWGESEGTISGKGATRSWTVGIRQMLPRLIQELGVTTILDAGCGDFSWMAEVDFPAGVTIAACDVVPQIVIDDTVKYAGKALFFHADITRDILPQADLVLCRTVLFHLSNQNVVQAIRNMIASGPKWLLTTCHFNVQENRDIKDGGWRRLNLTVAPVLMPIPERSFRDGQTNDGHLSLWDVSKLSGWKVGETNG